MGLLFGAHFLSFILGQILVEEDDDLQPQDFTLLRFSALSKKKKESSFPFLLFTTDQLVLSLYSLPPLSFSCSFILHQRCIVSGSCSLRLGTALETLFH